jgi:predicted DNA binding CopG/RHH family protein
MAKILKGNRDKKIMVSLRMQPGLVKEIKKIATRQGRYYQDLIREWLFEKVEKAQ